MNGTDMVITAIEGGINHWADVIEYNDAPGKGKATVIDREDGTQYTVTAAGMTAAAQDVLRLYPDTAGARYIREDDIDAEAADMIFQTAVLGGIVYG